MKYIHRLKIIKRIYIILRVIFNSRFTLKHLDRSLTFRIYFYIKDRYK